MWKKDGKYHRDGGPARIWQDGTEEWFQYGRYHREDGPAIIQGNYQAWFQDGMLHRIDGPAIINSEGNLFWYIDGVEYQNGILWRLEVQKWKREQKEKEENI